MAVIFFDGFGRPVDTNYWTLTGASFDTGNSWAGISTSNPVTNKIRLSNIGTHTSKKVYLGFRMNYTSQNPFNTDTIFTIYNSSNNAVLSVAWDPAVPDVGLVLNQNGSPVSTYSVLSSIAPVATGHYHNYSGSWTVYLEQPRVFEFEFDLVNNTVAVHYQGQSLFTTTSAALTSLTLGSISAIEFSGNSNRDTYIRDMYLVDDTGTFANTWLGVNFAVNSPNFASSGMTYDGFQFIPDNNAAHLNSDDGDTSYIRTVEVNKFAAAGLEAFTPPGFSPVVAGIRVQSSGRKLLTNAAYKYLFAEFEMGTKISLTNDTYVQQPSQFINVNPYTAEQWILDDIYYGIFGIKSVDPT